MTEIVSLSNLTLQSSASTDHDRREAAVRGGVITIGNFDGVHLGHAALLQEVRRIADRLGGPAVAVVLDPHPATILRPDRAPTRLTWIERRAELMARYGIDALVVCATDRAFLNLSAETFFRSLVQQRLQARAMVEGPNFFFGRDRGGDSRLLGELCAKRGIELNIVQPKEVDGEMISSTRIRQLLASGQVAPAVELLGAAYQIRGTVVSGARRGRAIGFPTANLEEIDVLVPGVGVYGGTLLRNGQRYPAAIHIGPTPTFEQHPGVKVEIHLLDYDGDLYGQVLLVDILFRVRDIARFDSADDLVDQLHRDISLIRSRLAPLRRSRG